MSIQAINNIDYNSDNLIKNEKDSSDEEFIDIDLENDNNIFEFNTPKHLYDCLLGTIIFNFRIKIKRR
jgi:hypothetical protein